MRLAALFALAFSLVFPAVPTAAEDGQRVRIASVNAPVQSGLLDHLLAGFEAETGYRVEIHGSSDPYGRARAGQADLVLSHYGKAGVEAFVGEGHGLWPRMVFSNQMALIGPASDPAGIDGMADPVAALRRIAEARALLIVPPNPGSRYLAELLVAAAGDAAADLRIEPTTKMRGRLIREAEKRSAYTLWGAFPFGRFSSKNDTTMKAMVLDSPVLHRVMAVVRVNPERHPGVDAAAAERLQDWLLSPRIQARVLTFREHGHSQPTWWPAARSNAAAVLLEGAAEDDGEDA